MIFLLFVVSVVVMEAILSYGESKQPRRKPGDQNVSRQAVCDPNPVERTEELLLLGRALENRGYDEIKAEDPVHPSTTPIAR